ncbi:hypothetical protein [Paraburkholderia sp. SIMBA_054]|uniref:hypothetical protein n=1 Tax=Paraburkholderia sp. SIMBA_054 TaxID=3085795 RepID=UPI00397D8C08
MSNQIHTELAGLSKNLPAGYVTIQAFSRLTLERLIDLGKLLANRPITTGNGQLSARLLDLNWDSPPPTVAFENAQNPLSPDREVDLVIRSPFTVRVELFITGDPKDPSPKTVISTLTMKFSETRTHLRAENNSLILEGANFLVARDIKRVDGAEALLAQANIDPLEAARVEGHIGYGVVSQSVTNALARRSELALSDLFPAINFGSSMKLAVLAGGDALGILPSDDVATNSSSRCACTEGPDFEVTGTTVTKTVPADPKPNDQLGTVRLGGPVADNKDPLRDFGLRIANQQGLVGLYIPLEFAQKLVPMTMPAVKMVATDDGTIGFRAEASVGFKNQNLGIDLTGGGLLLDFDLDVSVSAYCDMELFKGLRVPIGWAIVQPMVGSKAHLQLGFYPSVSNSGTVSLKPTLKQADMGEYVAVVVGVGTALKFLGVTAWIGFLVDVVLSAILSHGLPIALKKRLSEELGSTEWKLIEGVPVLDPKRQGQFAAPFDAAVSSLLASFDFRG